MIELNKFSFGLMVRHHRQALGLSIKECAWKLNVSESCLSVVENGKSMFSPRIVRNIIDLFKLDKPAVEHLIKIHLYERWKQS